MDPDKKTKKQLIQEITSLKKRIDKEINEQNFSYLNLIEDQFGDFISVVDLKGKFTYASPSYSKLGYNPDELIGTNSIKTVHPDDRKRTAPLLKSLISGKFKPGDSKRVNLRLISKSGEVIEGESIVKFIKDPTGKPLIISVVRDDTEKTKIKLTLAESENKFRALFENAPLPFQSLNEDGFILDINPQWLNFLGYERDEVVGKFFGDFLHPEYNYKFKKNFPIFKKKGFVSNIHYKMRHKNGDYSDVTFEARAGYTPEGNFKQSYCVFKDITEQIISEKSLSESELRYRSVTQSASDAIIIINSKGIIESWNGGGETIFGYSNDEIINENISKLIPKLFQENHQISLNRVNEGGKANVIGKTVEMEGIRKGGALFPLELSLSTWETDQDKYYGGIIRDITDRKRSEKEILTNQYYLEKSQEIGKIGTWEFDIERDKSLWTDENYKIFGIPSGTKMNYALFLESIHPDDRDFVNQKWNEALKNNDYDIEHRVIVDGNTKWVREKAEFSYDEDGSPESAIGFTQDITDRKLNEIKTQEINERYINLFNASPQGILTINKKGMVTLCNPAFLKLSGYSEDEIVNKSITKLPTLNKTDLSGYGKIFTSILKGKIFNERIEFNWIHKDGSDREGIAYVGLIYEKGRIAGVQAIVEDITTQNKMIKAIAESEEKYRSFFETVRDGAFVTNFDGDYIDCNQGFVELTGYENKEEISKVNAKEIYGNPNDRTGIIDKIIKKGFVQDLAFMGRKKDGTKFPARMTVSAIKDKDQKIIVLQGSIKDISEQVESERKAQHYLNIANVMILALDEKGSIKLINKKGCELLGFEESELLGRDWFDLAIPEKNRLEMISVYEIMIKGQLENLEYYENPIVTKNGQERLISWHNSQILDKAGNITGTLSSGTDITSKKISASKLEESNNRYDLAMNAANDGIFDWNLITNEIYYSPRWKSMLGYADEELPNDFSIWEHLTKPEDAEKSWKMQEKLINKQIDRFELEFKMKHKEGHWIDILSRASAEFDETGKAIRMIGTHVDITERKKLEQEKRELEAFALQHQKLESIGTLASGVAHEINNPITGIMNYAQLISERLDPKEGRLQEFADAIVVEAKRIAEIVKNLLTFSRDDKQTHSSARITDISDQTLSLIRTIIKRDQIELKVDVPDDLPEIKCRSQQIQQVLMNLLTNARDSLNLRYPDYDPDKIISIKVSQFEADGRRWLRTTVEDHGVGIPAELGERIFDPFFTTKDRALGTGLGLSISLGIAKDHHGELTFESVENEYTRFYLDLPVDNGWKTE